MIGWRVLSVLGVAAVVLAACDKDPASSMRIVDQRSAAAPRPVSRAAVPPPPEAPAGSSLAQNSTATRAVPAVMGSESDGRSANRAAPASGAPPVAAKPRRAAAVSPGKGAGEVPPANRLAAGGTAPTKLANASAATDSPAGNASPHGDTSTLLGCPPPPEESRGPSTLRVTGPCKFDHSGTFGCEARGDDFYLSMKRKAARGAMLVVYVNVEGYRGPGDYQRAQMYVSVHDKTSIHRWSNEAVALTVGPDAAFAVLLPTRLEAEPMFVDCSGPVTDLQCMRRRDSQVFNGTIELASGELRCEFGRKKEP